MVINEFHAGKKYVYLKTKYYDKIFILEAISSKNAFEETVNKAPGSLIHLPRREMMNKKSIH